MMEGVGYRKYGIERTKTGLPAVWEAGGGYTNTGWARVVANSEGGPGNPLYIRRRGELANSDHALVHITPGSYIIEADHHREDFKIEILRVVKIPVDPDDPGYGKVTVERVAIYDQGEWDVQPPAILDEAIEAVKRKATEYHCRRPVFISEEVI